MPIIPIPDGLRRVARDSFDESEAERYRAEADAKLKRLQDTPMAQLGPDEPLKGDFKRPTWMGSRGYDTPDFTSSAEPTIVPAEGDESRDLNELGLSPRFSEDLSRPAAPESNVPDIGFGSGGPEGGVLSEATILDIRQRLADKQASTSADKDMRSRLLQGVNPDEAASAIDLAAKSGVNRLQVEVNPETYKRADTMRQIDQLRTTAPKLRAWLDFNPENLDVSHDDVDNLSWWEQIGSFLNPGSITAEEVGGALRTGAVEGGAQQFYGAAEAGIGINRMFEFIPGMKALNDAGETAARTERQKAAMTAAANMPKGETWLERGIYGAAQSAPASIEAMIVSVLTKNPLPGVATMGVATGGQAYGEAEDAGKPFLERMRYAVTQGGIEAATEFLPLKFIVGDLAKDAPLGKMFLKNALAEGIGEQAATFLQDASTWLELNPEKTLGEFMAERPNAAMETLVASTLMTGMQTTIAAGVQKTGVMLDQQAQQDRSDKLAKTFDAMAQGAADSKLLKRLPQKYRDAVAKVTKDGPLESVRVQPEAFNELAQSAGVTTEQLAQAFRIDPNDIVSAIESGEDVVIPSGNYAAALSTAKKEIGISGEQIHTAFAPNMRLRADDFTAKEREAMKAVFEEEQAARAESGTKEQGFADSADRVRETIREQVASLKIFNTEAANTQATIVGEMVTTLAERTGQDPETLWKEQGFDIVTSLMGEDQDPGASLPQSTARTPVPIDNIELDWASQDLEPRQFEAWKGAREGLSNEQIADRINEAEPDARVTALNVRGFISKARSMGYDVEKAATRSAADKTRRLIDLAARGISNQQIADRLYRDDGRPRDKILNSIKVLKSQRKAEIAARKDELAGALTQGERGTFTPRADRSIVRLFESSNLSTLVHEGAHWYLDTLWRMAQTKNPHPFVLEQLAAILEWQGKSPNWTAMFDADGKFTKEGVDIQEAFAETFEAYLREGKAPTSALRSVFASFKAWLSRIYRSITQIGSRVRLNDEIRQVFDRMLATEDAIKAATTSQARDSAAMAQALLAKGIITEKAVERTTERLQAARERAEAELMARLMEDYERSQKAWWRDEERQVRREVQSEIDERPEQRAYAWLSGKGWRDTREDHIDTALEEAEGMALLQRQLDLPTPEQRAAWVRENTVSDVIPGEASNSRQYGFKLSNGLGIVASLIPQVNGETEIHWTFLSRLMDRASEEDVYAKGDESLTGKEVLEMMPRILAIVETDMAKENRDAYTFTSARRSIRNMNARLVRLLEGFDYEIVEFPGQDDPILLHKDADIGGNGKIIPRPENAGRKFEWDRTEDPEAYADAFYAKVSDLGPGRPAGRSDSGERDRGNAARGELADAVRYVDLNATTESLRSMQARMVADNVVPAILLFRADDGRVIAVGGEDVNFSHDQARDMLGLGDIHLAHGVYNPRKWPSLSDMDGPDAWYATTGGELGQDVSPLGFYSALSRAVAQSSTNRASAAQWKATLSKAPGVKADEIEWTGINDWLDAQEGPVTREAVLAYLDANGVRVQEVQKGSLKLHADSVFANAIVARAMLGATNAADAEMMLANDSDFYSWFRRNHRAEFDDYDGDGQAIAEHVLGDLLVDPEQDNTTQFDNFVLPGGSDYTELLLTLPDVKGPSTHWDEPNVVAHVRFKTRTGANGERVLAIEEVQSDWHQKGREQGYNVGVDPEKLAALEAELTSIIAAKEAARKQFFNAVLTDPDFQEFVEAKRQDNISKGFNESDVIPEAMADRWAANNSAARPDLAALSKAADDAYLREREVGLARDAARNPTGIPNAPFKNNGWVSLVLKRMIRHAAENGYQQIAWIPGSVQNGSEVDADDNRSDFYDKIVVNAANKIGKKYGAQVGQVQTTRANSPLPGHTFHSLPLTPELKAAALEGFALFQTGGNARTTPPASLPPMRLDLSAVREQYGDEAVEAIPPEVRAYSAQATDADQFLEIARDVRKTLGKKHPKSLWKFLSTQRRIGKGNDRVAYSGIRDDGGEIIKIIGEKKAAPGLINDKEDGKRVRAYTIHDAAVAAWEEGYTATVLDDAAFLDALRADFDGTAKLYAQDDIELVQDIANAEQWATWFDQNGIDINEKDQAVLRTKLEEALTSTSENAIGPDEAASLLGGVLKTKSLPDGKALLDALKQGPLREKLIREETQRRMIATHGDIFKNGTIAQEAQTYARNEIQERQLEIELEALAKATGQFAATNLAKQEAIANLRTKQVREVLNYNQWLVLEQRWGKKALEAAEKGKFDEAARYKKYQLLNMQMFREGRKLAEQIEKTRKTLIAYGNKPRQQRLYAAGREYAETMNGLLDDYQLRHETKNAENKRVERAAWIKAQMAAIDPFSAYQDTTKTAQEQQVEAAEAIERSRALAADQPTEARGYKSLTVDEFMAVDAEATMIWKMATIADQLLKEGKRRRLTLAAEDIAAEIITNQPKEKPPEPIESDAPGEKVKRNVLKYFAMHRTMQSLAHQFAGGKDGGQFWSYFVKPLNAAYAHLSTLRKQMGEDLTKLFGAYSSQEIARFYKDRQTFNLSSGPVALTTQGRLAVALNVGNEKNRQRLMDSMGWTLADIQTITDTLTKRDWDFIQKTWDYLNTWFPEANRVHEAVHGAPMDKVEPMQVATKFGIYAGGYYPIAFDPELSSKSAQRQTEADAKKVAGRVDARSRPGFGKKRVEGKVTLPLKLSVFDVITRHLDQVATSIATEEVLFDAGRLIRRTEVEDAIVKHHGRQIYNTIVNTLVTTKFGMEGTSGILAHLRNGATVVGLGWKVSTALLQPLGVSNSVVRVGGYWVAKGYARMGRDAATIQSSAKWVMDRSEFMRHRRQSQSPELAALKDSIKKGGITPRWLTQSMFALMSNTQFYSVDLPTWYAGWYKAKAAGLDDVEAAAQGDQAVIDAQGGGELHQTAAIQTGAGTKYAAALRLLTNFMSYMVTTYNLATQRARNADTVAKMAALTFDMVILLAIPVAGKMALDAWTKGGGDDDDELWEKYGREQAAFLMSPFVGISQVAGAVRGEDAFGYRGPAGLGIFAEATNAGKAAAEGKFFKDGELDPAFWRPANKTAGMIFHYPASQLDLSVRGATALWKGEETNPAVLFFGPPPK